MNKNDGDAPIDWRFAQFNELGVHDLYDIMSLRTAVFIVEQACAYQDADGVDSVSHHLWCRGSDGAIAAYLRIVPPGVKYDEPSLGRIITSAAARRTGLGMLLVQEGIERLHALHGVRPIRIGAQQYLLRFYERLGFCATGYDYDEDGIPHSEMLLR
ncbi:MAG: GNAT family N-acetyltransferase [Gemmatimonadota bacterium]|nr:GNAT family N-acetyltransferase [Gemmatimonadota bacterium]